MAKGGIATVLTVLAAATLPRLEHPAKNDGSLSLLVVRDWGRKGECNPFRIAQQMGRVGEKLDIDYVVSTGVNFYNTGQMGRVGDDDAFEQSFTDIYRANSLQKPWHLVLGNHDYKGDALAQFSPALRKIDSWFNLHEIIHRECWCKFTCDRTGLDTWSFQH
ncbi:unnamed protein product [Miscanthus lutarioriparius]|uniref:Calcineurin-like phosphoesterase domain-containing protein n=1 Tax=Miscanthus lutarioriparius TaxID=422564 RepID=A0A811SPA5_9POAL|nr:unnamed protein product [Miscanthus lutarioriparius]